MKAIPRFVAVASAALVGCAITASAHPGHEHSNIPSLIRHPFAGPEHLLGSAACRLAVAGLLYALTRRVPMPALVRWSGLSVIAVATTLVVPA